MNDVERHIEGKTIRKAEVDGFGIRLHLSDGTVFDYDASDGGHSLWEITLDAIKKLPSTQPE
jgi:hypothetical protein